MVVRPPSRMEQLGSHLSIFRKSVEKIQVSLKPDKNNGTNADQYPLMIISRSVHLGMRNASDKSCREHQNTKFMFNYLF